MKQIIIILSILLVLGCSRNVVMKESTAAATPQYLEEIKTYQEDKNNAIEQLQQLHNSEVDTYYISVGDKFDIEVYDEPDLYTKGVIVKPDGRISYKLIGEVKIAELSVAEATQLIEEKLRAYLLYPKVSLIPSELTGSRVTIMGKIVNPGSYQVESDMHILDVIATAGGLATGYFQNNTVELADLKRSYIVRNNRVLPVDFLAMVREGDMLNNIPVMGGDYIYIPSSVNREIYIIGEVVSPGNYLYKENMTLLQAIGFAKGFKETTTMEIAIIRGSMNHPRVFKVKLKDILKGNQLDFPLEPNDIVYIPRSTLAEWNKMLSLIMPSLEAIQGGWMLNQIINPK